MGRNDKQLWGIPISPVVLSPTSSNTLLYRALTALVFPANPFRSTRAPPACHHLPVTGFLTPQLFCVSHAYH